MAPKRSPVVDGHPHQEADVTEDRSLTPIGPHEAVSGVRRTARQRTRTVGVSTTCLAWVLALSIALPANAAVPPPPPVEADRPAFEHSRDAAIDAVERGDWHTFLDESERALQALPESSGTHGERAQVMQPIGTERIDERSEPQLRRSVAILELYVDDLERAYGDKAETKPGWAPAQEYLADLRARLPAEEPTPFLPMPSAKAPPKSEPNVADRTRPPGRGLVIGGGVSIGVGIVLLIAGVVQGVRWKQADNRYEDLRQQNETGTVTNDQEHDAALEWARRAGGTLGTVLPGVVLVGVGTALIVVGVRKRNTDDAQLGFSPGGMAVRF